MPYIGNTAANRFVASKSASVFSGNGSNTTFTLDHGVGSDEDILVSVDGVIQEPSVAYSVSGTTLTFTSAPSNNSGNNIFVYYLFRTIGTVSHPSSNALQATSGTFSGNLDVTGTTTLSTKLATSNLGTGAVLQVTHQTTSGSSSSTASSSLTSYTDAGLTVSITPTSTSNKILVFGSFNVAIEKSASGTAARIDLRLVNSDASETAYEQRFVGTDNQGSGNLSVLDTFHGYFSPSSTSSQTYKVQVRAASGDSTSSGSITLLWYTGAKHTMTAMEIAG